MIYSSTPKTAPPPVRKWQKGAMDPKIPELELLCIIESLWQLLNDSHVAEIKPARLAAGFWALCNKTTYLSLSTDGTKCTMEF